MIVEPAELVVVMTPPPTSVPLPAAPVVVPLMALPVTVERVVFPAESVVVTTTAVELSAADWLAVVVVTAAPPVEVVPTPEIVEVNVEPPDVTVKMTGPAPTAVTVEVYELLAESTPVVVKTLAVVLIPSISQINLRSDKDS